MSIESTLHDESIKLLNFNINSNINFFGKTNKLNIIINESVSSLNKLLNTNDIIFMGDIKSHNIVKNHKNKKLNQNFNDMKFNVFKKRLLYKANVKMKRVFLINESYTTQVCSSCGNLWKGIGSSKEYECQRCDLYCDRDINSAKNICMKGIITMNMYK